jgi:hypothetical protein
MWLLGWLHGCFAGVNQEEKGGKQGIGLILVGHFI